MSKNRKAAEAVVYEFLNGVLPNSKNNDIYKKLFEGMDDDDFYKWIQDLKDRKTFIALIAPEGAETVLNFSRNLKLAEKWNHKFYQRIWLIDPHSGIKYLSNNPYLIIRLPLKRQAQFLIDKISIPEDNYSVNNLTGQATGKSKGSTISNPELQILNALKLDSSTIEMIKMRGGDLIAFNAMNNQIYETGSASIEAIDSLGTNVKVVQSLSTILTAMHLSNTLMVK